MSFLKDELGRLAADSVRSMFLTGLILIAGLAAGSGMDSGPAGIIALLALAGLFGMAYAGIGMAIAANKIHGIRAAAIVDEASARLCREHNDANVITLGARLTALQEAQELLRIFLTTEFMGGRHQQRVDKITALDK